MQENKRYSFTDKEINELMEVTCGLSRALDNLDYLRNKGVESWDKKYEVTQNYFKAKNFLTIPEVNRMFKNIERVYSVVFKDRLRQELR